MTIDDVEPDDPLDIHQVSQQLGTAADLQAQRLVMERRETRFWRIGFVLFSALFLCTVWWFHGYIAQGRHTTKNTNQIVTQLAHVVSEIDAATSPEAQAQNTARTAALVTELVEKIDCSNRAALQDVILKLEEQGVLQPDSLVLTCPSTTPGVHP